MSERLTATPGQTIGPFFHDALPYERGHELVPPATPGAVRLHGTVYDGSGAPIPDALLEIRQAGPDGQVPRAEGSLRRDGTVFTGWGRAATDPAGRYSFTTLEPAATTPGAAPFFSVVVFARGLLNRLFTRAYLPGPATEVGPVPDRARAGAAGHARRHAGDRRQPAVRHPPAGRPGDGLPRLPRAR